MKNLRLMVITAAILAVLAGITLFGTDESSADANTEYIVYYLIDDPRLGADQYSIDCEGVYVSDTYVFFKTVRGSDTQIGTLPSTQNIVSRFYSTTIADDGYVLNPEGSDYGFDVSGWFTENTYENRVTHTATMGDLDDDDDGIIFLHMKAARLYDVKYHLRNYVNSDWSTYQWYDGYHLEREQPAKFNQNRFAEVDYAISFVEGQPVPDNLPTTSNMYSPGASQSLLYLALANWAKDDGSYNLKDDYEKDGHSFGWAVRSTVTSYPTMNPASCTPVYPGLTVTDSLDPDGDGVIELYGTSVRTSHEDPTFFLTTVYAQEDNHGRSFGADGYNGFNESHTIKLSATIVRNTVTSATYKFELPVFDGFVYHSFTADSDIDCEVTLEDGVYYATIIGTTDTSQPSYSGSVRFDYARRTVSISVVGETTDTVVAKYGVDMVLPSTFSTHTLYYWQTSNLTGDVHVSGPDFIYTPSIEDMDAVDPVITAYWQEGQTEHAVYTVQYISRVDGVSLVSDVIDETGFITLPMIVYPGYSHLGWALINPDDEIDYDTTSLVIYPGRTSFEPAAVSSVYKSVNPQNENMITVRLYAIWCTTYSIHFEANGGSGSMEDVGPIMVNEYYTLPTNQFTKNNATFIGWSIEQGGTVVYTDRASVIALTIESDSTFNLYAVWSVSSTAYVIYDKNGGELPDGKSMDAQSVTLRNGSGRVTLNDNQFVRPGYTFYGWSTSSENSTYDNTMSISGNIIYKGGDAVGYIDGATDLRIRASMSLFAIWVPNTYHIDFDANGGTGSMSRQTFIYGVSQSLTINTFTKQGFVFGGWVTEEGVTYTDGYIIQNLTTEADGVITLCAVWTRYYISFDSNNNSGNVDVYTAYTGVDFVIPDNMFSHANHLFVSWNTARDGSGTRYDPGQTVVDLASDGQTFLLFAVWREYTYIVEFDANNGTGSMDPYNGTGGVAFNIPQNVFVYTDRTFLGWTTDPVSSIVLYNDCQEVVDLAGGADRITLYAVWSNRSIEFTLCNLKDSENADFDIGAITGLGLDSIQENDTIQLTLSNSYSEYESYQTGNIFNRKTYYLDIWTVKDSQGNTIHTYSYGAVITITSDFYGCTMEATYTQYKATIVYHSNIPNQADSTVSTIVSLEKNGNRYTGSTDVSECKFPYNGYIFCMWSQENNEISNVCYKPGDTYSISATNRTNHTVDLYAVWIKVTVSDQYYTGSYVQPMPAVTTSYGSTVDEEVTGYTRSYSNNVNAGRAVMQLTLPVRFCSIQTDVLFNILPARVTIEVSNLSKYYGEDDPTLTVRSITCNTSAPLDGLEVSLTREAGDNAGTYAISASFTSLNYTLYSLVQGTLTIDPAIVTVVADNATKYYGQNDPAFTGTITCNTSAPTGLLGISFYRINSGTNDVGTYSGVISATFTPNGNYDVRITPGDFEITLVLTETAYYIILDGRGGGNTYTDSETVQTGTPYTSKTVTANAGYSFYEWVRVTYSGNTIIALTHVTYSSTLESEEICEGTYIAIFVTGNTIKFNANGGTAGTMADQHFGDRNGTLDSNAYQRQGYVFIGWSLTADGDVIYNDRTAMTQITDLSTAANDNVLYAVWRPCTYTSELIWTIDGHILLSNDGSFLRANDDDTHAVINGGTSATVSSSWLGILSDGGKGLIVNLQEGTIEFDHESVNTFATVGKDVTFSIRAVAEEGYETFDIKNGGNILAMYSITASYIDNNGGRIFIHALNGNAAITLDKPVGANSVVYVGEGTQPSNVNPGGDTISFMTDHFSMYGIVDDCNSEAFIPNVPATEKEDVSTVIAIGIAAGITTIIAAVLVIQRRRL